MFGKDLKKMVIFTFPWFFILTVCLKESSAQGEGYPDKPIKLIVGTQPGGASDLGTRAWSDEFSKKLGVPMVIINQGGGGGTVALANAAGAKPDGYTLASVTAIPVSIAPAVDSSLPYDTIKDLAPIGIFGITPLLIVVNANSPFKTIEELLDYAKKNPGKLNCGTAGAGTIAHIDLEIVKFYGKVEIDHVPFKASAPATAALLGNHVDLNFTAMTPVMGHLKAGRMRALLTTNRIKEFPDVPLFSEKGFPQAGMAMWTGLLAPAKIPKEIHKKLVGTFEEVVVKNQGVIEKLNNVGLTPFYLGPDDMAKRIKDEMRVISDIAKKAGIKLE
jgi:tripartite-type tricarboxylate transporter receptor subunit TctC